MSRRTRFILLAGILLFIASCLYPPWETVQQDIGFRGTVQPKIRRDCGWGPLWRSTYMGYDTGMSDASLAWPRLAIEWAIIAAVTSGTVLLAARRRDVGAADHPEATNPSNPHLQDKGA